MNTDEQEALAEVRAAIGRWYAASFEGRAVLTDHYLIATGTDADGTTYTAQDWDADIVTQLGLTRYAARRVEQRMDATLTEED